ncbi:MAG: FapA family protein [Oscillospiraceae bacterium]|nr:FapA family protein [Oscillospiraceae bacterium]
MSESSDKKEHAAPQSKARITVNVVRQKHEAEMLIERTGTNTVDPTHEELAAALAEKGIVAGIKEDLLLRLAADPVYNEKLIVAVGKRPEVGKPGELRYKIRTTRELKPALREDDTVDYKDLGYTNNVEAGQVLVEIIPPTKGEDGFDVLGAKIEGIFGKETTSPKGAGTDLDQAGNLVALVAGNATFNKGVISIQEVLKIKGSIDNSTGDIDFAGDIMISGDVSAGFRVTSRSNITVKGIVEGAHLKAKGDIIIGEGINGMNSGTLTAGGNIRARFMQNCTVRAGRDIYADTIMHADLECDGDVELNGKRGVLIGGSTTIAGKLVAKGIGTPNHAATNVVMGGGSITKQHEYVKLGESIKQIDADITKLVQILNRFDGLQKKGALAPSQRDTAEQVRQNYNALTEQRKAAVAELEEAGLARLVSSGGSYVECKGRVHTGVKFVFGPLTFNVQAGFVNSRIGVISGEVAVSSL